MQNFEYIYKQNYQKLYTLAFRMTGNVEASEDVLQNSFMNAYKAFSKFKGNSSVYTWLYKIVLNSAKKYIKEERKLPVTIFANDNNITEEEVYNHINSYGNTEDNAIIELTRETCLQMFMNCMPSKYRVVYTLRSILDFTIKETAEILGIQENTVKVNLHRAKKILHEHADGRCSLINPKNICNCRLYAKFIKDTDKFDKLQYIDVVRKKEEIATHKFKSELKKILDIDDLYLTEIVPIDYDIFLERIKNLNKSDFILMDY